MDWLTIFGSIASIVGLPSIFGLLIFLHTKHVSILKDHIILLESEKLRLEENTPDRLVALLESRREAYEILLQDKEQVMDSQKQDYENNIQELDAKITELRRNQEILEKMEDYRMGGDYRYELSLEHQKERSKKP